MKMILAPIEIYSLRGEDKYIQRQRNEGGGWECGTPGSLDRL